MIGGWFVLSSQGFQGCICEHKNDFSNFYLHVWCAWDSLDRNHDAIIALFTIVIGIFTGLLFTDGREKNRKELRAYVAAVPTQITGISKAVWRYKLINQGQTPAHQLIDVALVEILPYPLPKNFKFPDLPIPPPSHLVLLPRVDSYTGVARSNRNFTLNEIEQVANGENCRIYIFGIIKYFDIFGEERTTKFCESIIPTPELKHAAIELDTMGGTNVAMETECCNQHNEAD
jgi:hypothetical protein